MRSIEIKYFIKLLSDTCCGSGSGNGTDVDIAPCFDECGLPVIPSKRLRGLIREKAFLLEELYGKEAIVSLFGDSGIKSRLIVGSANVKNADAIKSGMDKNEYSPAEVSAVFTTKHTQTAIDAESGVAKDHSLRTIATIKKGTEFEGSVIIEAPEECDEKIVSTSFKLLRSIGLDKHRGLGEVTCITEAGVEKNSYIAPQQIAKSEEVVACEYTLTLEQNVALMLNSPMQNPDFIPGAALQGAFARRFSDVPYFSDLFFSNLKFGNAYISDGKNLFTPSSMAWVKVKNEPGKIYDLSHGFEKGNQQYVPVSGYSYCSGEEAITLSVNRGVDYHINKKKNNAFKSKNPSNFYNTERISAGQVFKGLICGSKPAVEEMKKAFADGEIRIGAASSSEYGKCEIAFGNTRQIAGFAVKAGETVVLKMLSDCIIVDGNGTNQASLDALLESLNNAFDVQKDSDGNLMAYTRQIVTGGYNAKWGMPKPQYKAFSKGSAFVLKCTADVTVPEFIGIGNSEGYGQLSVESANGAKVYACGSATIANDRTAVANNFASKIISEIEKARTIEEVEKRGVKAANMRFSPDLSASAFSRLLSMYQSMKVAGTVSTAEFRQQINNLNQNPKLRSLAEAALNSFTGSGLQEEMFDTFLKAFIVRYKEIGKSNGNGFNEQEGE